MSSQYAHVSATGTVDSECTMRKILEIKSKPNELNFERQEV